MYDQILDMSSPNIKYRGRPPVYYAIENCLRSRNQHLQLTNTSSKGRTRVVKSEGR